MLAETLWPEPGQVLQAVVDLKKPARSRVLHNSFLEQTGGPAWRTVRRRAAFCARPPAAAGPAAAGTLPFVPATEEGLQTRCAAIARIQATGLAQRMEKAGFRRLVIGVSGGLDSTSRCWRPGTRWSSWGCRRRAFWGFDALRGHHKAHPGQRAGPGGAAGRGVPARSTSAPRWSSIWDLGHAPEVYDVTLRMPRRGSAPSC